MQDWLPPLAITPTGAWIRLPRERWDHIRKRHPELADHGSELLRTLAEPDAILEGDAGARMAVRLFDSGPLVHKHVVVVYREASASEGFVITAYISRTLKKGRRIVWPT